MLVASTVYHAQIWRHKIQISITYYRQLEMAKILRDAFFYLFNLLWVKY